MANESHPLPWRVSVESHKFSGMRYHVHDATGADVCVLDTRDDPAAEETARMIAEAVNARQEP